MVRWLRAGLLAVGAALVLSPPEATSCGPDVLAPVYTDDKEPAAADQFVRGDLGILAPGFRHYYLAIAYRYLTGGTVDPKQLGPESAPGENQVAPPAEEAWRQSRSSVPGAPDVNYINRYRDNPETHDYYLNCYDDAFVTATATLRARVAKYGVKSEIVRDWLNAQDTVFADCSEGKTIPAAAPPTADALARADRNYQIACAHFYTTQFEAAKTEFLAIGNDASSPWLELGPYLAARAMIRAGAFEDAERQLKSIVENAPAPAARERARRLIGFVETKLHPVQRMTELAREITAPHPADFWPTIQDYIWLYDVLASHEGELDKAAANDDLTDWIQTFQGGTTQRASDRWQAKHSTPWLIAALYYASPDDPATPKLIAAADQIPSRDPGYLSAQYYAALTLENSGHTDAARQRLNRLLEGKWPENARNLLLAARMKIDTTWQDFLRDVPRRPGAQTGYDYAAEGSKGEPASDLHAPGVDFDGALIFNRQIPLNMLAAAAKDSSVPASIRRQLSVVAWTRAVVLGRMEAALDISPILASLVPLLAPDLHAFESAPADARGFAAVWAMLHNPGLGVAMETGFGRLTAMNRIDTFRDNWWCSHSKSVPPPTESLSWITPEVSAALGHVYGEKPPQALFLTQDQKRAAEADTKAVDAAPAGPNFLAERTLAWANAHPDDPRLPEALHLVVRATRYGCTDDRTQQYSRRAFDLLHRRFPASQWTKKTPYWFQ